jgi:hypothetical protein
MDRIWREEGIAIAFFYTLQLCILAFGWVHICVFIFFNTVPLDTFPEITIDTINSGRLKMETADE